jgi:hypothetical protein
MDLTTLCLSFLAVCWTYGRKMTISILRTCTYLNIERYDLIKLLGPQTHTCDGPYWIAFLVLRNQWLVKDCLGLLALTTCEIALVD